MQSKILAAVLVAAGVMSSGLAQAVEDGPLMFRARAVSINFENGQSNTVKTLDVQAKDRWIPEVDISYFFTPNIAAELVLTYPQDVRINAGSAKIGTVRALPPSLLLQYHFTHLGAFKPYVGLGLNHTFFFKRDNILNDAAYIETSSTGLAAQVGFDYMLDKHWSVNLDVKYIQMNTDVMVKGTGKIGKLDLNPITAGVGLGYRF